MLDDDRLFERLTLEAFESGLSWLTILRKRPAFRAAFAGFHIPAVAAFGVAAQDRLLGDAGIVLDRLKTADHVDGCAVFSEVEREQQATASRFA